MKRPQPEDYEDFTDFMTQWEMIRLNAIRFAAENEKLLAIVKRTAKSSCCLCCDSCLACDAQLLLNELGENK